MITVLDVAKLLGGLLLIMSSVFLFDANDFGVALADLLVGGYLLWTAWDHIDPTGV